MFLWSLISSPGHPHIRPSSPLPCSGRLAMIVTEYMENGSLDAFLRVCLSRLREGWTSIITSHTGRACSLAMHTWDSVCLLSKSFTHWS